jgi:hypothetical protein
MGLGRGKTEHAGARDMGRKHGHWGFTEEAKAWATRARRRDEREELSRALADALEPGTEGREPDRIPRSHGWPVNWIKAPMPARKAHQSNLY